MSSTVSKFPYSKKESANYGQIDDLVLNIFIQTPSGFTETKFIFDTGADVSMLPKSWLNVLHLDQTKLKCHFMTGASEEVMKVYCGIIKIKLEENSELFEIPVTFSKSDTAPHILGKAGILNRFTVTLNHQTRMVSFVN